MLCLKALPVALNSALIYKHWGQSSSVHTVFCNFLLYCGLWKKWKERIVDWKEWKKLLQFLPSPITKEFNDLIHQWRDIWVLIKRSSCSPKRTSHFWGYCRGTSIEPSRITNSVEPSLKIEGLPYVPQPKTLQAPNLPYLFQQHRPYATLNL